MKYIKLKAWLKKRRKEKYAKMYLERSNYGPICLNV